MEGATLPGQVRIGGFDYEVLGVDVVNKHCPRAGEIDVFNLTIRVDSSLPVQRKLEALLHEIVHGISHDRKAELSEDQVDAISNGLVQVLRDNPAICRLCASLGQQASTSVPVLESGEEACPR